MARTGFNPFETRETACCSTLLASNHRILFCSYGPSPTLPTKPRFHAAGLSSYYTSLGLFVSVPGLWSLIKHLVKSKIVQKTFIGEGAEKKAPNQVAAEILSFFTRNNFMITDRRETITGVYYCKWASRKEQIKVKMLVADDGIVPEIVVQGDDQQVNQMRKELKLSEKGMVYVKGLFER